MELVFGDLKPEAQERVKQFFGDCKPGHSLFGIQLALDYETNGIPVEFL